MAQEETKQKENLHCLLTNAPEGLDAYILGQLAQNIYADHMKAVKSAAKSATKGAAKGAGGTPLHPSAANIVHVVRDEQRMEQLSAALKFFAPTVQQISFPGWDCVPYDRVSPNSQITARRISALARMALMAKPRPTIIITTLNAIIQRVPPRQIIDEAMVRLQPGVMISMDGLIDKLQKMGFFRTDTVMERGEYAVRGGILDIFPPGRAKPLRLDFFGDTLEIIRQFDPATQRSSTSINKFILLPNSEVPSSQDARKIFRQKYIAQFGAVKGEDPLYEAISEGAYYQGQEHWLPFFYEGLETLFDYLPGAALSFDHLVEDAFQRRQEQITDHHDARHHALEQITFGAAPYKPIPPDLLFINQEEWNKTLGTKRLFLFSPFAYPESENAGIAHISYDGKIGRNFAPERRAEDQNHFDAVIAHIHALRAQNKIICVACWSKGSAERINSLLTKHGLTNAQKVENWDEVNKLPKATVAFGVLGLESGFETPDFAIIGEQDILGDRLIRPRKKSRSGSDVLKEVSGLAVGDLVVHADHGIARFEGLQAIEAGGAPHDCLILVYHGGDKLYLPVENIELLTRYGSDDAVANLDRLGGSAWQGRKAKLKKRIRDIAEKLIAVAAERALHTAPVFEQPEGVYEEFCATFPYEETEDQKNAIASIMDDFNSGRPMDRLICGDVGFGKTEVALRSSLFCAMAGKQVAVVVPTTLLARQHYKTFSERFAGFPVRVAHASRMVGGKELNEVKKGLADGSIDIVVGTHALLGKSINFADIGLIIIDEEQHFGVQHKERLKALRSDVHVLTLTATPIPRTLQLALTGVRELSLITTPPVDRLAVRTFITPFDPVLLREALLRERYRGGQSFYVCPRISDLDEAEAFLREHVPELKIVRAHGQMPPQQLDDVMNAFYDRKYDVLLSTTIVESGLDIPTANTLIVHRADMFGLSQLYQLRGRVGRSKIRAYALFTLPVNKPLTPTAEKRLKVLQSLDTLGAGFNLANHDLDIRGAGNLLGEEQSGHVKEVGFELYQSMLEEAVAALKGGGQTALDDQWSPNISIGTAVLIPEHYVPDLQLRLGLYRRLSKITAANEIDGFAAELVDRFGPLPEEVSHLLEIVHIKTYCYAAGIAQIEAGPKGCVVSFRNNQFANPEGLLNFIAQASGRAKFLKEHKLVYQAKWDDTEERLKGARDFAKKMAALIEQNEAAA